jgi:PAS domain S-box-containing protein
MSSTPATPDELGSILHHVGDGITAQGPDGRLVYANDAAARLCGLESAEEMLRLTSAELLERFEIIGEDREPLPLDAMPNRRAFVERAPQEGVLGYRILPGGDERWSVLRSTPMLSAAGELQLVINVFHDITKERATTRPPSPTSPGCSSRASPTTASSTRSTRTGACARS